MKSKVNDSTCSVQELNLGATSQQKHLGHLDTDSISFCITGPMAFQEYGLVDHVVLECLLLGEYLFYKALKWIKQNNPI